MAAPPLPTPKKRRHPLTRLNHISKKFRALSMNNISTTPFHEGKENGEELEDEPVDDYDVFIDARLENLRISAMADTGNLFRLAISKVLADKLQIQQKDLEPLPGYTKLGTAAEGEELKVLGRVKRPLRLNLGCGTRDILVRPIVLENLSMHANLSGPFLRQHGIDVLSTGFAKYQGKMIPLVKGDGDLNALKSIYSFVYTAEDVVVGPNEGTRVPCVATSVADGSMKTSSLYVTGDGSYANRYDLHAVTAGLVNVDSKGKLDLPTANTTNHPIKVPKGTLYGSALATTTPDRSADEPWKVCILQPPAGGLVRPVATVALRRRQQVSTKQQQVETEDSVTSGAIDKMDIGLESYMAGDADLPQPLRGPTTSKNRRLRIHWLLRFFKLKENPNLRDKVDLSNTIKILLEFWPIFAWDGDFGRTHLVQHAIEVVPGTEPIHQRHRPSNPLLDDSLKNQLSTWQRHNVIEPSNSPWNFALVPAVKKGGKIRWCCGKLPKEIFLQIAN